MRYNFRIKALPKQQPQSDIVVIICIVVSGFVINNNIKSYKNEQIKKMDEHTKKMDELTKKIDKLDTKINNITSYSFDINRKLDNNRYSPLK